MGEAKRKKSLNVRFLGLMGMESKSSFQVAESVWITKGSQNFELAQRMVAWRSDQLSAVICEMLTSGEGQVQGVEWIRWPSGREQTRRLPVLGGDLSLGIESRIGMFSKRANGLALLTFSEGQMASWPDVFLSSSESARAVRENTGAVKSIQALVVDEVKDLRQEQGWQIKVTCGTGLPAESIAVLVIDELEKMAASGELILKYSGRVMLTFGGLEKDEREAWDVPEVQDIVRLVSAEVKWWPLMTHLTHAYLWLACCLDRGETQYLDDGQVFHDFDAKTLSEKVGRWGLEAAAVMAEAGLSGNQAQKVSARVLGPLSRFVASYEDLTSKVASGQLKLSKEKPKSLEPLLWRSKFEGVSGEDLAASALSRRRTVIELVRAVGEQKVEHFGIVLDRSVAGTEALESLKAAGPWWVQRMASDGVKAWEQSIVPFLVIWGTKSEAVVLAMSCDSMDSLVKTAIPICVNRSGALKGKGMWAVAVCPTQELAVLSSLMGMGALE